MQPVESVEELLLTPLALRQELDIVDDQDADVPIPVSELAQGTAFHRLNEVVDERLTGEVGACRVLLTRLRRMADRL
jgi:hypothetical protein